MSRKKMGYTQDVSYASLGQFQVVQGRVRARVRRLRKA